MPTYEYKCECGREFDAVKRVAERHNITCACGAVPEIAIGPHPFRVATFFTTVGHDGVVIGRKQTTEKIPMTGGKDY